VQAAIPGAKVKVQPGHIVPDTTQTITDPEAAAPVAAQATLVH
jgi:hypothetical protein